VRRARAARRAAHAVAGALDALERLVLADRTAELAAASRNNLLSVAGTATPAERAWVLAWHLLAATACLHSGASAGVARGKAAVPLLLLESMSSEFSRRPRPSRRSLRHRHRG
jgi:hypothetical protein